MTVRIDKSLVAIAALFLSIFAGTVTQAVDGKMMAGSKPNIVFVLTDDQGVGDLSCMGNRGLRTPHIDELYRQSTRLTDYHVSPTCDPTRAALVSARPPFKVGVTHTIRQRERMALDVFTMPQSLKSAGYTNGLFGKWHLGDEQPYLPQNAWLPWLTEKSFNLISKFVIEC